MKNRYYDFCVLDPFLTSLHAFKYSLTWISTCQFLDFLVSAFTFLDSNTRYFEWKWTFSVVATEQNNLKFNFRENISGIFRVVHQFYVIFAVCALWETRLPKYAWKSDENLKIWIPKNNVFGKNQPVWLSWNKTYEMIDEGVTPRTEVMRAWHASEHVHFLCRLSWKWSYTRFARNLDQSEHAASSSDEVIFKNISTRHDEKLTPTLPGCQNFRNVVFLPAIMDPKTFFFSWKGSTFCFKL